MRGETSQGVSWYVNEYEGEIEFFHMNEQYPAHITRADIKEFIKAIDSWEIEKQRKEAEDKIRQEQQDYQDYLRLKERFENK